MDYLLFSYPNCNKCDAMKKRLAEAGVAYQEYGVTTPPGKAKIREFINVIKRDDTGAIILPTLVAHTQGIVRAVLNTAEEFEAWSRSKG
ncbi:MAG TPA: glutaredoxin domain-containing protein [Terriglobales bacterium]|nr:glutaredoxin domain-containing protein [Terriglobales bacterium]